LALTGGIVNIKPLRSALLALGLVGPIAVQAASTDQWQRKAEAAVATIRGTIQVPGLQKPVRVQRDRWGVAHIYAENSHDLFFAQGYVVAQDRLFQMELWKRSGQGRLAEILGPEAVARDTNARRLLYRGDMEAEFRSYAPDTKAILEAFTAGINAYIAEIDQPGGRGLPIEFQIAGFRPEAWHPADCLNRMAAYTMTGNASSELKHAQLVELLGARAATTLFDFDPKAELAPAPGSDFSGLSPVILKDVIGSEARIAVPSILHESNDWTISGALTASGKPLLANDPHRIVAEPSLRYIVHLVAPGWNVIGAGEPGLPGVAVGHNDQIGWGFTIFGLDQQDLYLETVNPADPLEYQTPQGWERMTVIRESIAVRGAPAVQAELKFTRHGPVLWQEGARALALRWVGTEPGTAGYLGSLALDRARNWQEFEAAMPRWKVPSENIVYADREGNIGEHSTGLAPLRSNGSGLLPVPGKGGYEWNGFIPNGSLPHSYNPVEGFMATANQKMIPDDYPYAVAYEWYEPFRYLRIKEVLEDAKARGRKLGVPDMEALQGDVVSMSARDLQRLLREAADRNSTAGDDRQRHIVQMMLKWDGALRADAPEATIYEFWAAELRSAIVARLVPVSAQKAFGELSVGRMLHELSAPTSALFGSDPESARDALLFATLDAARSKIDARLGSDIGSWAWGNVHRMTFRHSLDSTPWAAALMDRGPMSRSGDGDVVQSTEFVDDSYDQIYGASYREIFDLADWDKSVGINVPGQSGQPGSKHYDDLLPLWRDGKYFPLAYTKGAVDAVTTDVLNLAPAHR
jgi:penicillin amidase